MKKILDKIDEFIEACVKRDTGEIELIDPLVTELVAATVKKSLIVVRAYITDIPITVYCTRIDHKHGTNIYLARTEKQREEQIYDYVRDCWSEWMGDEKIDSFTKEQAIEEYFNLTNEYNTEWLERFEELL